jgi:hypothetical protein
MLEMEPTAPTVLRGLMAPMRMVRTACQELLEFPAVPVEPEKMGALRRMEPKAPPGRMGPTARMVTPAGPEAPVERARREIPV